MPFFSKVFKSKDASGKKSNAPVANGFALKKPQWTDAWLRTRVDPEEVVELLHECTLELKSRGLDVPFLLLPFRPSSDPSAARSFIRNFFFPPTDREPIRGKALITELKMTEVMVIISVVKWCWARLPGGVVTWETYEMFKVGEKDTHLSRDAFTQFIPISVESNARIQIIRDFFDLLAAVAAHGKTNGLGGIKLSRFAGWWAFEHYDTGKGFDAGYKSWSSAAHATSHLFFAYLRSLAPEPGKTNGILDLPRSLQQLVHSTTYPPPVRFLANETTKVVMIVDVVSPTPYALLRRAKNFEYRDDDYALQEFADYDDPVKALTDECRRVIRSISSANQSNVSNTKTSTSLVDPSWSRFEDIGFGGAIDEGEEDDSDDPYSRKRFGGANGGVKTFARGQYDGLARPTTPSWADFLSSGFAEENGSKSSGPMLLPPDKILPPIQTTMRGQSSQSHRRNIEQQPNLDPGELASITKMELDDAFWWVWISSLAGEEPTSRKAVFGRCALIETILHDGKWMIMEEQVKGAAPEPAAGAYIAEKKTFLRFATKRGRLTRRKSGIKKNTTSQGGPYANSAYDPSSRATLAPDQQARIQLAAAALTKKKQADEYEAAINARRNRPPPPPSNRNSVLTLGPFIKDEASPALQWASQYDKKTVRAQYLGNTLAGKGSKELLTLPTNGVAVNRSPSTLSKVSREDKDLPPPPPRVPEYEAEEGTVAAATAAAAIPIAESRADLATPVLESTDHANHIQDPEPLSKALTPPMPTEEPPPLPTEPEVFMEPEPAMVAAVEDAATVPLPPASPEAVEPPRSPVVNNVPSKLRKSIDGSRIAPELKKNRSRPSNPPPPTQKTSALRKFFGNKRSKSREPRIQQPDSPVEANPAVAAARRALEGKAAVSSNTPTSPVSPGRFARMRSEKSAVSVVQPVTDNTIPMPAPPKREPTPEFVSAAASAREDSPAPPVTRRDAEYDELSRVDTNEREHADREFSTFDQGPLVDQPAFTPGDAIAGNEFFTPMERDEPVMRPNHLSTQTAVTMQTASTEDEEDATEEGENGVDHRDQTEIAPQVSPGDRWAQIRKNAADRAARQSEEHTSRSRTETRTDDGETSGEETIESRVARIKARVAELTGNMDGARR